MSSITSPEIKEEFLKNRMGVAGISILVILVAISIMTVIVIPVETFQEWNNPENWIAYPKIAIPSWANIVMIEKIPEHMILEKPDVQSTYQNGISLTTHQFGLNFNYDDFPDDFIYIFSSEHTGSPLLQISVIRPDGIKIKLLSTSLPYSDSKINHSERIFSTDESVKKNLMLQSEKFEFALDNLSAESIVFFKNSDK